jgi:hypothetical protein
MRYVNDNACSLRTMAERQRKGGPSSTPPMQMKMLHRDVVDWEKQQSPGSSQAQPA